MSLLFFSGACCFQLLIDSTVGFRQTSTFCADLSLINPALLNKRLIASFFRRMDHSVPTTSNQEGPKDPKEYIRALLLTMYYEQSEHLHSDFSEAYLKVLKVIGDALNEGFTNQCSCR